MLIIYKLSHREFDVYEGEMQFHVCALALLALALLALVGPKIETPTCAMQEDVHHWLAVARTFAQISFIKLLKQPEINYNARQLD